MSCPWDLGPRNHIWVIWIIWAQRTYSAISPEPSFNFHKQDLIFSRIMRSIQLNHEISKNVLNLGSGAWKPHLGCIGTTMFGCSIRVKSHIGTIPCWELWGNLVLCHPLDSIAMSLVKVDFGNQSAWIPAICVNTVSTTLTSLFAMTPAKLIKSWYAYVCYCCIGSFYITESYCF